MEFSELNPHKTIQSCQSQAWMKSLNGSQSFPIDQSFQFLKNFRANTAELSQTLRIPTAVHKQRQFSRKTIFPAVNSDEVPSAALISQTIVATFL